MSASFENRLAHYTARVADALDRALPPATQAPKRLHDAMRYAVFNGGKRVRPLLSYATGECLGLDEALLDAPAASIELIHAFSLVHDDLPAMDDDDIRRGKPTLHRQFDEATAILAADALQPLAFSVLAEARDVAHLPDLIRLAERGGLSEAEVRAAIEDRSWEPKGQANRDALTDLGHWGVPSLRIGSYSTWGQDRIPMVEAEIARLSG